MPIVTALVSNTTRAWEMFQEREPLTFDQPVGDLPVVDDVRWSAAVTGNSWGAFLVWVAMLIVLHAVSWPIVRRVFTRLPDRGWAYSRLITMLVAGYLVWLLASLELIAFRAIWVVASILLIGAISLVVRRRLAIRDRERSIYSNPIVLTAEIVFWAVFGLFLVFRLINPDSYHPVWGGEKPMEFAHLNAILRSAHFPPVDPWYSGGFINYYYYGTYLVAFLIKLTGIPVEYAFNLAQPTFPALLASASFSLTAALGRRITGSMVGAWISGIVGTFFVSFAGNLIVAERVIDRLLHGLPPVDSWSYWVWDPSRAIPFTITEFPYFGALYADLHPHVIAMPFTILIAALAWQVSSSWRALPLMVVGRRVTGRDFLSVVVPLLISSLAVGSLFMANAWDMPMFAIIVAVGVIMLTVGAPDLWRRAGIAAVIIVFVGALAFVFTIPFNLHYVALFGEIATVRDQSPFLAVQSHLGGQLLLVTFGIAALIIPRAAFSRQAQIAIGLVAPLLLAFFLFLQWRAQEAGISPNLALSGIVLITVAIWLLSVWSVVESLSGTSLVATITRVGIPAIVIMVIVALVMERHVFALYAGIGLSAGLLWLVLRRPSERFLTMLIAGATLLGASLEIVYLVDDLSTIDWYRMNTVFKFYNQIWNLLGVATGVVVGYAVWHALVYTDEPIHVESSGNGPTAPSRVWTWLSVAAATVIGLASFAYPVVATPVRLDTRFEGGEGLTLNAYAWMQYAEIPLVSPEGVPLEPLRYDDDLAAINWFNENVDGTPVIAEAAFGTYRCNGSRFSIATGLPAVIGWKRHQEQQRYLDDLAQREADLRELYTTTDENRQEEILDQYNVEYVIVGQSERHYPTIGNGCVDTGSPEGIESLESLAGTRMEVAFESGSTTVYRVIRD